MFDLEWVVQVVVASQEHQLVDVGDVLDFESVWVRYGLYLGELMHLVEQKSAQDSEDDYYFEEISPQNRLFETVAVLGAYSHFRLVFLILPYGTVAGLTLLVPVIRFELVYGTNVAEAAVVARRTVILVVGFGQEQLVVVGVECVERIGELFDLFF